MAEFRLLRRATIALTVVVLSALTVSTVDASAAPSATPPGHDSSGATSSGATRSGTTSSGTPKAATTNAPTVPTVPTVATVTERLAALGERNEQLTESYNQAVIDLAAKQAQAALAQQRAEQSAAAYAGARNDMKLSLQAQYQEGTLRETTALLTSQSGQDYVDQSSALQQISDRRAGLARQMAIAGTEALAASQAAMQLVAVATLNRDALARQRIALAAAQKKYHVLLDKLTAQQRLAFLAASTVTVTKQKLKAVVAASSATATKDQHATVTTHQRATVPTHQQATVTTHQHATVPTHQQATVSTHQHATNKHAAGPAGSTASNSAQVAVRFALAQRGKPYVYATSGPNSYDCSGLTAAAWQAAGVSIPHQSAQQYRIGQHVSRSQLQPGDLVFFYSPIHHVALYIGDGLVVHAPTEGDVVKVIPLSQAGPYTGATRI